MTAWIFWALIVSLPITIVATVLTWRWAKRTKGDAILEVVSATIATCLAFMVAIGLVAEGGGLYAAMTHPEGDLVRSILIDKSK